MDAVEGCGAKGFHRWRESAWCSQSKSRSMRKRGGTLVSKMRWFSAGGVPLIVGALPGWLSWEGEV